MKITDDGFLVLWRVSVEGSGPNPSPEDELKLVSESYQRCLQDAQFISNFYQLFFSQGGLTVSERFKNTDMKRQMAVLRDSLQYMIMFASGSKIARGKIEDLGYTHDRLHRNITPEMYKIWLSCLLMAIEKADPNFNEALKRAWASVMSHGIVKMKGMY